MIDTGTESYASADVAQLALPRRTHRLSDGRRVRDVLGLRTAEVAVAFLTAVVFLLVCMSVAVNPLTRVGQVSGLAGLQFRFAVFGILAVGAAVIGLRSRRTRTADATVRLVCAAVAGLASALVGAGLMVALYKTPYGIYAEHGDMAQLIQWATDVQQGKALPKTYPPLPAEIIAAISRWTGESPAYAMKTFQIFGAAVYGPLAYLSWRLVLRPVSALLVGVLAALPLMDLYKPYTNVVLVMMVPVLVKFVEVLRDSGRASYRRNAVRGAVFGVGMGLLFELYFGWFLWSALGIAVAIVAVFPWWEPGARGRAAVFLGVSGVALSAVTFRNLIALMTSGAGSDTYVYFDVRTEPTYFLHWFSDEPPANLGAWPPVGDLGGVGLFTLLLFVGFAAAVALRRRDTLVLVVATSVLSAWLMRFWTAEHMYASGVVGLYPRTDVQILFGLLVLSAFMARHFVVVGLKSETVAVRLDAFKRRAMVPGVLAGVLFLTASMGDATANSYMPSTSGPGTLTMISHTTVMEDGGCPAFTAVKSKACTPSDPSSIGIGP
ncbi:hypothetical protein [Catenulispora rubra]|uniref:hypothetical protein n=1 Tax=Catenulispora rubra TaxID=280293 RepID=UPI001891FBAC|nr:hypothetical protein [Catenulispora rubra]